MIYNERHFFKHIIPSYPQIHGKKEEDIDNHVNKCLDYDNLDNIW